MKMSQTALVQFARPLFSRSTCKASLQCRWLSRKYTTATTAATSNNTHSAVLDSTPTGIPQSANKRTLQSPIDKNTSSFQPQSSASSSAVASSSPLLTTTTIPHPSNEQTSQTIPNNTPSRPSQSPPNPYPQQPQQEPRPPISGNIRQLLPLLKAQERHYITIHIHDKPYLVTPGDVVRLPFLMHGVVPGDVLRLNRASVLGSRDFTLKAGAPIIVGKKKIGGDAAMKSKTRMMSSLGKDADGPVSEGFNVGADAEQAAKFRPETCLLDGQDVGLVPGAMRRVQYIDDRLFECRAVVMGTESEPMRFMIKKKQRQRRKKTVKSRHKYTILKIKELLVKDVEALEAGA